MKNIILFFAFGFLLQDVSSNAAIFSKLHQHQYKMKNFRMQLMSYDREKLNTFEVTPFKFNRTTTAHNITINFKFDPKDELEILMQAYKFISNQYRIFPAIRFQVNVKKAVDSNALGMVDVGCGNCSNFYFYKDTTYYMCNFIPDETHLPPLIPNGQYRFDATYLYLNKELALLSAFCEFYTPIPYPKK